MGRMTQTGVISTPVISPSSNRTTTFIGRQQISQSVMNSLPPSLASKAIENASPQDGQVSEMESRTGSQLVSLVSGLE